jgi:hypothetical protein
MTRISVKLVLPTSTIKQLNGRKNNYWQSYPREVSEQLLWSHILKSKNRISKLGPFTNMTGWINRLLVDTEGCDLALPTWDFIKVIPGQTAGRFEDVTIL